ncbi:hypothetical protein H6P81_004537 [Aristolochia fimbriata]|uniref:Uncharacterized protein n=1 Tax=Aristolochia fimbriata TaxID=158543 RepID=A0AAV7FH64_ARIFI|nr:hypothetical protein H6P81_004537 [Aristolochia fimbriata]
MEVEDQKATGNVPCLLTDPEENPLGSALYLRQNSGPVQLLEVVNKLLHNLGTFLEKNKVSVEKVLQIIYQPQAIFRIRPVNRCSATIAVLMVSSQLVVLVILWFPYGTLYPNPIVHMYSGGGDGTIFIGSQNCTIKVWETRQGKLVPELKAALERYNQMEQNAPERLESGSDGFTMFLWEPAIN